MTEPGEVSYFDATTYTSPRPRELDGDAAPHQVVVVGAGPVGLALALDLAQRGVRVTLVDRDDKVSLGSRALALSYRSLEILGRLGIVDRYLAEGVPWNSGRSFYRGHQISSFRIPQDDDVQYPGLLNLQQPLIETFLIEACLDHPNVEIRWNSTVETLTQREDRVELGVSSSHGPYALAAEWVVAADGARSTVRELVGAKFEGVTYNNMFVIVDIRMASKRQAERLCWFDPPAFPARTVLLHKQPYDIWRIDFQVSADENPDHVTRPDYVIPRIRQHLEWIGENAPWELEWASVYRAHALTLPSYRKGRVLFAGDAAHLLPIFGVRGLNSGLVDVVNLGWKLADVVREKADVSLLDSYDAEQRDAFNQNRRFAHLSTLFMTPGSRGTTLVRDAALDLALVRSDFRALADPRYSTPVDYFEGPLIIPDADHWAGGPASGQLVPNKRITLPNGRYGFLNDVIGPGHTLLMFEDAATRCGDPPQIADLRALRVDVDSQLGSALDATPGTWYLVRPDRHVLTRLRHGTAAGISSALGRTRSANTILETM